MPSRVEQVKSRKRGEVGRVEFHLRNELIEKLDWLAYRGWTTRQQIIIDALMNSHRELREERHRIINGDLEGYFDKEDAGEDIPFGAAPSQ